MAQNDDDIKEVDVVQAREMIRQEDLVIIDIRAQFDFENGSIAGARHLTPATFEDFLTNTDKNKTVLCYCYFGHSSLGVCAALKEHGFANPVSLKGGFTAWQQQS